MKIATKWFVALVTTLGTLVLIQFSLSNGMSVTSPLFSWVVNFALMFWFTIIESQFKPKLDYRYFASYPFEKEGKLYNSLGVHVYRRFLRLVGWEKQSRMANPVKKALPALQQCERATRVSELGHTLIALIVLGITVFVAIKYSLAGTVWLLVFNVLLNIYPILVQRYNRPRYTRAIRRLLSLAKISTVS
ncbi:hypothetical protein ACO2Q8_28100 [Larkinella sp. VNQ87]|uniref:glycosyl-4,4'-diaponeurosporenoate acyltransferase CrtO family protein n=1 Tax=Larkinella sp. VNQ87 TaxID=3400921 RepID=UPI003BFFDCBF